MAGPRPERPWAALVALVLVAPVVLAAPDQDDAGTGQDAGDTPATALALPEGGSYTGTLDPVTEADWYTLAAESEDIWCVQATALGGVRGDVTLAVDVELDQSVTRQLTSQTQLSMGLASAVLEAAWLGVDGTLAPVSGEYAFSLEAMRLQDLGPADAGTGGDAGATPGTGLAVPGPCWRGDLNPSSGDARDVYTFDGLSGELVTLSVMTKGSNVVEALLVAPDGEVVLSVPSGSLSNTTLDEAGTWSVQVQPGTGTGNWSVPYAVGLSDGPEPRPCRPMCLDIV